MKPRFHIVLIATILALIPFYQSVAANQNPQTESIVLGMGCFWGAEKRMSALPGVIDVESGYANGDIEASYR
ncbi:MAG: peptide-methionine (S)-S-oxide reductase, partial [Candidatus Thiodiazotropha sp. 6PDIVS]